MSEYLTKEEIRQWRSSLEKITLEEYAARLGKKIEEEKQTEDIGDVVMRETSGSEYTSSYNQPALEKLMTIGSRAFKREKEITKVQKPAKTIAKKQEVKKIEMKAVESKKEEVINISFNKNLTAREQTVFEYFASHKNCVVYAKELAEILGLPRDYVYKYIKNLRAKIKEDALCNAENGGFILKV